MGASGLSAMRPMSGQNFHREGKSDPGSEKRQSQILVPKATPGVTVIRR